MKLLKVAGVYALIALLPVLPYVWKGYAGHDFLYHVSSWLGVVDAWRAGQAFPTWSASSNFGLGDPRFCFYPPVSLVLGGLLTAALPSLVSPAAFIWVCFVAAGLAMYFASRGFVAEDDRVRAGVLYMVGPYFLLTALVRFAVAELLVQAWLPLLAVWLYRALWERDDRAMLKLGCLLGLSWLTDVPATIMLLYGLAPAAWLCAWRQTSLGPVLRFAAAEALGGALAAFYLAPAWVEKRWINMGGLLDDDPRLMLLFARQHGVPQPNYVLGTWLFACGGAAIVAVCVWGRWGSGTGFARSLWICLAATSVFFQLPVSGVFWRYLPEVAAVQFPYRYLPLLGLAVPLLLFARAERRGGRWAVYGLTAALSLFPFVAYVRAQTSAKMRTPALALLEEQWKRDGYMGKPEYVQPGVSRPALPRHDAPAANAGPGRCDVVWKASGLTSRTFATGAQGRCEVRLGTYYYPYWEATDEAGSHLVVGHDSEGLLLVDVPPGTHTVHVVFHPASRVRRISLFVSVIAWLFALAGFGWVRRSGREGDAAQEAAPARLWG